MDSASTKLCLFGLSILSCAAAVGLLTAAEKDRQQREAVAIAMTGGNPAMAPSLFRKFGCAGCHTIPGVPGADGKVGSALTDMRQRVYVAGVLNNTPENLASWIVSPPTFSPRTAMPVTGISERQARDLVAYLYSH